MKPASSLISFFSLLFSFILSKEKKAPIYAHYLKLSFEHRTTEFLDWNSSFDCLPRYDTGLSEGPHAVLGLTEDFMEPHPHLHFLVATPPPRIFFFFFFAAHNPFVGQESKQSVKEFKSSKSRLCLECVASTGGVRYTSYVHICPHIVTLWM